jgi:hypothetical protein
MSRRPRRERGPSAEAIADLNGHFPDSKELTDVSITSSEPGGPSPDDAAETKAYLLARALMWQQGALSVRVAATFLVLILGIPVFNWLFPVVAMRDVMGFSFSWFLLAVLFYPITWMLSGYFLKQSDKIEAEIVKKYDLHGRRDGE